MILGGQELTDPPDIQARLGPTQPVVDEVIAKGIRKDRVPSGASSCNRASRGCGVPFDVLRRRKNSSAFPKEKGSLGEKANVDRTGMARKAAECVVVPQKHLGAVGRVLVPKGRKSSRILSVEGRPPRTPRGPVSRTHPLTAPVWIFSPSRERRRTCAGLPRRIEVGLSFSAESCRLQCYHRPGLLSGAAGMGKA